jgi:hypothetical protein
VYVRRVYVCVLYIWQQISVSPESRNTAWVSFDGRSRQELKHGDRWVCLIQTKNKQTKQLKKNKRRSPLHKTNNLYIQRTYYYSPTAHHDQTLALPYQWWDCPNPTRKTAWWNCVQIMSLIDWECFDIDGTTSVSPGRCCCWLVVVCARRVAWLWADTVLAYACVFFLFCARVVCFVCFCVGCCALRCEVRFSLG